MRKGQFYMFAALILVSAVFVIVMNKSTVITKEDTRINDYYDNYVHEAHFVVNNAIYEGKNISAEIMNYTSTFISYARKKNIDLGIVFMYSREGQVHIVNYLNEPVLISSLDLTLEPVREARANSTRLVIIYGNESYDYEFTEPGKTEIRTLFVKEG